MLSVEDYRKRVEAGTSVLETITLVKLQNVVNSSYGD